MRARIGATEVGRTTAAPTRRSAASCCATSASSTPRTPPRPRRLVGEHRPGPQLRPGLPGGQLPRRRSSPPSSGPSRRRSDRSSPPRSRERSSGCPALAGALGQAAFKALVQEAYGRRCAVTGDKIVPVLQAAHIRPVTAEGENRVDNGLLLRSDVHTLFDRGYLGVHPDRKTPPGQPTAASRLGQRRGVLRESRHWRTNPCPRPTVRPTQPRLPDLARRRRLSCLVIRAKTAAQPERRRRRRTRP